MKGRTDELVEKRSLSKIPVDIQALVKVVLQIQPRK